MSARRFAAITASLLARKGEAMPSVVRDVPKAPILWSNDPRVPASQQLAAAAPDEFETERAILRNGHVKEPDHAPAEEEDCGQEHDHEDVRHFSDHPQDHRQSSDHEKRHRISLALSPQEHERLGIVAVKKGLTRHQLMRDALDSYFEKLAGEYKAECACIAAGGCRNDCDPF